MEENSAANFSSEWRGYIEGFEAVGDWEMMKFLPPTFQGCPKLSHQPAFEIKWADFRDSAGGPLPLALRLRINLLRLSGIGGRRRRFRLPL
jgi:hypothetical protein